MLCEQVFFIIFSVAGRSGRRAIIIWISWQRATASFFLTFTDVRRTCVFFIVVFWLIVVFFWLIVIFSDDDACGAAFPESNRLVKRITTQKKLPTDSCRDNDQQAPRALPQGLPQLPTALPRLRRGGLAVVCRRRRKL